MSLLHTRRFAGWARGHLLCRFDDVTDRFALTFDDGPNGQATPALLDLLRDRGAHATFFLLAENVRRHPDLVRRMLVEGHEPALHGRIHWPLALLPPWVIRSEVRRCADAITWAAGVTARFYRTPFGVMMPGQAGFVRAMGVEPVLGDVYPEDAQRPGVETIIRRVRQRLRGGSILILHDGSPFGDTDRSQTLAALAVILADAAARSMRATTIAELWATATAGRRSTFPSSSRA